MIIEDCWFCGGEADTSVDDDGYVFIGCKDANCPNNIFNSDNAFDNEFDAIVWWNDEARKVYEQCPKMVVQTNEEWLRSCTTEQFAEWLQEHMDCSNCDCNKDLCYKGYDCCKLAFLEWLKQPHTNN